MKRALEAQVMSILERNSRVEADKAWETSNVRRAAVALLTYATLAYFLLLIGADSPFLVALVPAIAYLLSTLALPFAKGWWMRKFYRK